MMMTTNHTNVSVLQEFEQSSFEFAEVLFSLLLTTHRY